MNMFLGATYNPRHSHSPPFTILYRTAEAQSSDPGLASGESIMDSAE